MSDEEKKVEDEQAETAAPEAAEATPTETPVEETPVEEIAPEEAPVEATEAPAEESAEKASTEPAYKSKLDNFDELKAGQTVRLHERIKDISPKGEERERIQVFEGIILGLKGAGTSRTLTIRKVSKGFGVEKIYPINSPVVAKIELVKTAKVRRAKLGYLKNEKRRFKRKLKEIYTDLGTSKRKKK
jgi:large subunit ribosomal protein L19